MKAGAGAGIAEENLTLSEAERAPAPRPLRVLNLITSFDIGGTERQAVELLRRIDRSRFDTRVAVFHARGPLLAELSNHFSELAEFPLRSFYDRNALTQLLKLCELLRREATDILHAHDFYAGLFGGVAARISGVRLIAAQRHLKLSDRRVHAWGTQLIHRLADRVLVNSATIRAHLLANTCLAPEKVVVIYNGLPDTLTEHSDQHSAHLIHDELCRELNLNSATRLVGMVARLQPVKGHRYFIAAAEIVARRFADVHFVLIGDGPLRNEIRTQAARAGIADRMHLFGERADAARLVAGFDLAALSSLHEGLPNAVLGAMVAGVPVIATSAGGTVELIRDGETGWLVPPADSAALAERMLRALENPQQGAELARRAQREARERFSLPRMVSAVEQLYEELFSASPRKL
jgi:glycosyltransferase involved in cell wall biosynthesis